MVTKLMSKRGLSLSGVVKPLYTVQAATCSKVLKRLNSLRGQGRYGLLVFFSTLKLLLIYNGLQLLLCGQVQGLTK